jgi:hypothetical protein
MRNLLKELGGSRQLLKNVDLDYIILPKKNIYMREI